MSVHLLGIRHHGPGSARNVRAYLEKLNPDIILVEGPPEADAILDWVLNPGMKAPVAILCYQPENPQQSVFYPFAEFSPEWQAILYAKEHKKPIRFFDLPIAHQFAADKENREESTDDKDEAEKEPDQIRKDPVSFLAHAAGFEDTETWWDHMFEYRLSSEQIFEAVAEGMKNLREHLPLPEDKLEMLREAHMRKMIRQAEKEMFTEIAVVCGAWHVPALSEMPKQKEDAELLKGLAKKKVECTWIPWTNNRLSFYSGYGAGIESPGWYEHNWKHIEDDGTLWMSKIARLFRKKGIDTSVAHVIESVRLASSLAALRGLSKAGLQELNEATLTVLCNGESIMFSVIENELIVGNRIGEVPTDIPRPPLQVDIEKQQKSLRLPASADYKDYLLDLRKENDLARSVFLHRLQLLGINWASLLPVSGKGTFKEQWRLQWDPAYSVDIIERGVWGNTVEEAASKYIVQQVEKDKSLPAAVAILQDALPAELHEAIQVLIARISNLAATSGDILQMMEAIPSLVNVARYGNVRKTDSELVLQIISGLATRICIGLPNAVASIDEEAAQKLLELIRQLNDAISVLQNNAIREEWIHTLKQVSGGNTVSPVIKGYSTRILADYKILEGEDLARAFHYQMSLSNDPYISASWAEGFLKGSGSILLVDLDLWNLLNQWVGQLDEPSFIQVLPLLRRTFSNFTAPERRKIGEMVKSGGNSAGISVMQDRDLDTERALKGIPVILQMLGAERTVIHE